MKGELTRELGVPLCSRGLVQVTTESLKVSGRSTKEMSRAELKGILSDCCVKVNSCAAFVLDPRIRGPLDSRLFSTRSTVVHGLTRHKPKVFIKHYTSCILKSCSGIIGAFVCTCGSSEVGQVVSVCGLSRGRTMSGVGGVSEREHLCCRNEASHG